MFDNELTSQQAADRVGVSRPFLTKYLEPYRMVGNRRRYRTTDVDSFSESLTTEPTTGETND